MDGGDSRELKALLRIAVALEGIDEKLTLMLAPEQQTEPEEPVQCEHPEEHRIPFGMTNGKPDWQCGLCQYRTVSEEEADAVGTRTD